jgi:opacity protein-like surface antigen
MKRIALASVLTGALMSSALAADLPARKAPPYVPVAAPFSWTGFYGGLNLGYGFGSGSASTQQLGFANLNSLADKGIDYGGPVGSGPSNLNGILGGGQIGYNWQFSPLTVIGVEADIQGAGLKSSLVGSRFAVDPFFPNPQTFLWPSVGTPQLHQSVDWFGTLRGRVGFTPFSPTVLIYATGGLAYGDVKTSFGYNVTYLPQPSAGFLGSYANGVGFASSSKVGWTAGAGLEWAATSNWSFKLEYLYTDLGSTTMPVVGSGFGFDGSPGRVVAVTARSNARWNTVRAGVNYHFWSAPPAPVVAKY